MNGFGSFPKVAKLSNRTKSNQVVDVEVHVGVNPEY